MLDHGRGQELSVKEALQIQMTPSEEHFNRDRGLKVPGCWTMLVANNPVWLEGSILVVYLITLAKYFFNKKQTFRHLHKCLLQCSGIHFFLQKKGFS